MALIKRGEIWHWRETIVDQVMARSTKTKDKKLAEQMVAKWKAEAVQELIVKGAKPVLLHLAIKAFLKARKGTGGYSNACVHMAWWLKLPNVALKEIKLAQLQDILEQRTAAGAAHNTVCVTVMYWNALMNFSTDRGWVAGIKLPAKHPVRTRMRVLPE